MRTSPNTLLIAIESFHLKPEYTQIHGIRQPVYTTFPANFILFTDRFTFPKRPTNPKFRAFKRSAYSCDRSLGKDHDGALQFVFNASYI